MALQPFTVGGISIDDATAITEININDTHSNSIMALVGEIMMHQSDSHTEDEPSPLLADAALTSLTLTITATTDKPQYANINQIDALAHVLCGLKRHSEDEEQDMATYTPKIPITWQDIHITPVTGVYEDVIAPLAAKRIIISATDNTNNTTKKYIRFQDKEVRDVLIREMKAKGWCDGYGITLDDALKVRDGFF